MRTFTRTGSVTLALVASVLAASVVVQGNRPMRQGTPAAAARPIRALYVTGGGFHEFVKQEGILPPAVKERANVAWTIDHTAGTSTEVLIERHKNADWAKQFDVVLYNMSFSFVTDVPWIERIAHAHRDTGVGAVILHGAVHSYRRSESRAWGELMGAYSLVHDSQRPLSVEIVAPNHPIMRGFPAKFETIPEELYVLERVWPTMTPLAQAFSVQKKQTYPLIWTNTYGKAKVFVTSLGHNTAMIANPVYLDMVGRAVLWTSGHLKDDGTPAAGYGPQ